MQETFAKMSGLLVDAGTSVPSPATLPETLEDASAKHDPDDKSLYEARSPATPPAGDAVTAAGDAVTAAGDATPPAEAHAAAAGDAVTAAPPPKLRKMIALQPKSKPQQRVKKELAEQEEAELEELPEAELEAELEEAELEAELEELPEAELEAELEEAELPEAELEEEQEELPEATEQEEQAQEEAVIGEENDWEELSRTTVSAGTGVFPHPYVAVLIFIL